MRWSLTHSDVEKAKEIMRRRGIPIPDDMYPPELLPGAAEWLAAFKELSTDRHYGMGIGPIPAASIDRYPVEEWERPAFRACIRAMDKVYMDHGRSDVPMQATVGSVAAALER